MQTYADTRPQHMHMEDTRPQHMHMQTYPHIHYTVYTCTGVMCMYTHIITERNTHMPPDLYTYTNKIHVQVCVRVCVM